MGTGAGDPGARAECSRCFPWRPRHTSCADLGPAAKSPLPLPGLPEQCVRPHHPKLSLTPGAGLLGSAQLRESSTQTPAVCPGWAGAQAWPWGSQENLSTGGRAVGPQESPWPPWTVPPRPEPHPHACPPCKAAASDGAAQNPPGRAQALRMGSLHFEVAMTTSCLAEGWRARLNTDLGRLEPV